MTTLFQLLASFFQVGLLAFGGGYAAIPLIQEQVTRIHPWLSLSAFTDLVTIAEMTPGPIALNAATFVGMRIAGVPGAVVATIGAVLPSCLIVSLLAWLYSRYRSLRVMQGILSGLRPAVVAMIATAGLSILLMALFGGGAASLAAVDWISLACFALGLLILRRFKPNPIVVMIGCGIIGAAGHLLLA